MSKPEYALLAEESDFPEAAIAFAVGRFGNIPDAMAYLAALADEDERASTPPGGDE